MEELITPSEKRIINRKKGEIYDYISYSNALQKLYFPIILLKFMEKQY